MFCYLGNTFPIIYYRHIFPYIRSTAILTHLISKICVNFRKETGLLLSLREKIGLRKQKRFLRKVFVPEKAKKERITMSNSNNNQLNIPQAREAMDKFKMQAAQDEDVPATS